MVSATPEPKELVEIALPLELPLLLIDVNISDAFR
jgi:hypothetical protein